MLGSLIPNRIDCISRREFMKAAALAALLPGKRLCAENRAWKDARSMVESFERVPVLQHARAALEEAPRTITAVRATRSTGGPHDYFSEGDYWWPDAAHPGGPYIRRDGESNPQNFVAHRDLLIRLSLLMPTLTAAWVLTGEKKFAHGAGAHLDAWFADPATRMNPNLEFAQAIHGISTGRSIGIIDTVHLVEVAQAAHILATTSAIDHETEKATREWFRKYLEWLMTSDRGVEERDARNNHGSCWLLQAGEFATYVGVPDARAFCRERFTRHIVPEQIAADGSLPLELARTKPYSYSLFDLDIVGMCARILSDDEGDLWSYQLRGGGGLKEAFAFYYPFVDDKSRWPYAHDVEHFDDLPVRQPCWLFAGLAYRETEYLALWRKLPRDSTVAEVIRNNPLRQPLLWL
jgi:hypothetical protein